MQNHWEGIYASKDLTKVSWFEPQPRHSLELTEKALRIIDKKFPEVEILDAGAGNSLFAAELVARGSKGVAALDISAAALEEAKKRISDADVINKITWIIADITHYTDESMNSSSVDVWHDRAVFHFMRTPAEQQGYIATCARVVRAGGIAGLIIIISLFFEYYLVNFVMQ